MDIFYPTYSIIYYDNNTYSNFNKIIIDMLNNEDYTIDYNIRLKTFDQFNSLYVYTNFKKLAQAGFINLQTNDDRSVCPWCKLLLHNWEINDNPFLEHAYWNSICPYITSMISIDYFEFKNLNLKENNLMIKDLNLFPITWSKKKKEFESINRLITYESYLCPSIIRNNADNFDKSGLIYIFDNLSHSAKCIFCKIKIGKWKEKDDPIIKHIIKSPSCTYMKLLIGIKTYNEIKNNKKVFKYDDGIYDKDNKFILNKNNNENKNLCLVCQNNKGNIITYPCNHIATCIECCSSCTICVVCKEQIVLMSEAIYDDLYCVCCKNNNRNIVNLPCGHVLVCNECNKYDNCIKCNEKIYASSIVYIQSI